MPPRGDTQLALGYWLVSHKDTLRKWWAISLMAFIGLSFLWGAVFTIIFFSQTHAVDQQILQAGQGIGQLTGPALSGPAAISISDAVALVRDTKHIDVVALFKNPNTDWGASAVTAHFIVNGQSVGGQTIFLNPGATRPLIALNIATDATAALAVSAKIDSTTWAKTAVAALPDATFVSDATTLTPTTITINGQGISTVSLRADITNRSVYNFRHVIVPVIIRQGTNVVAVDQITTDAWPTLTSKTVTSTWSYPLTGTLTAEVAPQVSRFDLDNVYR